jgi:site-specific DNA recombinase
VARQEADCRELAAKIDAEVIGVYQDNSVSAFGGKVRDAYQRMLGDLRHGVGDLVIAWHPDRLHRRPAELIEFIDLCRQHGVDVRTVKAGEWDPSPSGRAVAITLAAWAEYESGHKSERIRRKMLANAQAGKVNGGGQRPFGFEDDRKTIKADEALVIEELMRRMLAGESVVGLTRELNERGVPTVTGRQWRTHGLKRLLCSARIAGWRDHNPGVERPVLGSPFVAEAEWAAIVSRADVERVRTLLGAPERRRSGPNRKHLLSGVLRCSYCGHGMSGAVRSPDQPRYGCIRQADGHNSGCGKTWLLCAPADDLIRDALRDALADPGFVRRLTQAESTDPDGLVATQLANDEARLLEIGRDYDDNVISRAEYVDRRARVADRITATRRALSRSTRLAALDGFTGSAEAFDAAWEQASVDKRRAVITAVIERIVVHPAVRGRNVFDPSRIKPVWRA